MSNLPYKPYKQLVAKYLLSCVQQFNCVLPATQLSVLYSLIVQVNYRYFVDASAYEEIIMK